MTYMNDHCKVIPSMALLRPTRPVSRLDLKPRTRGPSADVSDPQSWDPLEVRPVASEQAELVFDRRRRDQGIRQPDPSLPAQTPCSLGDRSTYQELAEGSEEDADQIGCRVPSEQLCPGHNGIVDSMGLCLEAPSTAQVVNEYI
jgi:hypothetical protein